MIETNVGIRGRDKAESAETPLLFTPLTVRGTTFRNRIVISPMVQYRAKDGLANEYHKLHLGKFAMGGAAAIFTETTAVTAQGRSTAGDLGIWTDDQAKALAELAAFIRNAGGLPAIQLGHAGRKAAGRRAMDGGGPIGAHEAALGIEPWQAVGPTTDAVSAGWPRPDALDADGIKAIVDAFGSAAGRADAAGFEIAEIHGAHGYLIASFLSPISNTRNDAYGGDRLGRMRLALEVARAVREAWPSHKPLFFRVSSVDGAEGGWDINDTVVLAAALKAIGVDVVDCSSGGLTGSAASSTVRRGLGFQVPFAAAVRKAGVQSMAVGLILDGHQAEQVLRDGAADLIAIGRAALHDPFWPLHAAEQLGFDQRFTLWPEEYGWWLDKRAATLRNSGLNPRN